MSEHPRVYESLKEWVLAHAGEMDGWQLNVVPGQVKGTWAVDLVFRTQSTIIEGNKKPPALSETGGS